MDIDFHFSTVYVLARWAGFGSDNARNEIWLQRLQTNYFEFAELTELDQCLTYQPGLIMADADYSVLFYQGIEEHYAWVKSQLETAVLEDVI